MTKQINGQQIHFNFCITNDEDAQSGGGGRLDSTIIKYLKNRLFILELDRTFLTLNRGCKYCILQKKFVCLLKFYFTLIQLIVLNVESKCNLNRNIVNHISTAIFPRTAMPGLIDFSYLLLNGEWV